MASTTDTHRQASNGKLLTELLTTHGALLIRQARRHAQLDADAEEALHSAYALFLEKYRPPAEPLPWLLTTIKREAWRFAKRSYRRNELAITAVPRRDGNGTADLGDAFLDPDSDPAAEAECRELLAQRRAALAHLKPDQRAALIMFGLGYSYAEIAALRGWTMTKVNHSITEGRASLRQLAISSV